MKNIIEKIDNIAFFDLSKTNDEDLIKISKMLGLALNLEEMKIIKSYFKRKVTDVELQTFGQTWSEHCFHKTFKGIIEIDGKEIENILKNYIKKATEELNKPWCFSVFEDNAGLIEFDNGYLIAAKVETHNHPSAIEPFGGAATGIGGVIRDILGVWGEPIALTNVLCFGPLNISYDKIIHGIKHPKYIYRGVIAGIAHYGNNMGIPNVSGSIIFDEGYIGNPIVYCGCIGILHKSQYIKETKVGDYAILIGGKTGRDGIHGVTFASTELSENSDELRSAVQIPNPFMEEKLRRAIITIRNEKLASGITDLGGGGISCAIGETAYKHGLGIEVILDNVHLKEPGLAPWEIWISESQERMLITVPKNNLEKVLQILNDEDVEYSILGIFDNSKVLRVKYKGILICEINIEFLYNPPKIIRKATSIKYEEINQEIPESKNIDEEILELLSSPNIRSKEEVIRTYDHEVRGCTVIKPLQGDNGGPNDASVIKPLKESWMGVVISCGINPFYPDPYWMAAASIEEAIRNNTCVGGRRIALLDNFVWGSPEKEDRMGSLLRAIEACYDFSKALDAPFISGKDSLYNESPLGSVRPTLLITGIGIIPDVRKAITSNLKSEGNSIYIIGITKNEMAGSAYFRMRGINGGICPKVRVDLSKRITSAIIKAIDEGIIEACHDLSEGGLGVAAAEMTIASEFGMMIDLRKVPSDIKKSNLILFSESQSRFLVEVKKGFEKVFENIFQEIPHSRIGIVKGKSLKILDLERNCWELSLNEIRRAWRG